MIGIERDLTGGTNTSISPGRYNDFMVLIEKQNLTIYDLISIRKIWYRYIYYTRRGKIISIYNCTFLALLSGQHLGF